MGSLCWLVVVPRKLSGLSLSFGPWILVSAFGFVESVFSLGLPVLACILLLDVGPLILMLV